MTLHRKPVELIEKPLDGELQSETFNAPAAPTEIYLHQVVRVVGGAVQPVQTTTATGFYLAVTDTSPGAQPSGSFVNNTGGSWFAARPTKVDAVPISGKRGIISVKGNLAAANIGQSFGLVQEGKYTVLDLANTGTAAATILELVEGRYGTQNCRVMVRFN